MRCCRALGTFWALSSLKGTARRDERDRKHDIRSRIFGKLRDNIQDCDGAIERQFTGLGCNRSLITRLPVASHGQARESLDKLHEYDESMDDVYTDEMINWGIGILRVVHHVSRRRAVFQDALVQILSGLIDCVPQVHAGITLRPCGVVSGTRSFTSHEDRSLGQMNEERSTHASPGTGMDPLSSGRRTKPPKMSQGVDRLVKDERCETLQVDHGTH